MGAGASLVSFGAYLILTQRMDAIRLNRSSGRYFVLSVIVSTGWLSMFTALASGEVSVVSALIGTNPRFSIILSLILLSGSEKIDWRTGIGCLAKSRGRPSLPCSEANPYGSSSAAPGRPAARP